MKGGFKISLTVYLGRGNSFGEYLAHLFPQGICLKQFQSEISYQRNATGRAGHKSEHDYFLNEWNSYWGSHFLMVILSMSAFPALHSWQ